MIGQTVSHYRILEKLGEGGMGVVYKAEDTKLKRTVALKFLPPELTRDPEAKERFIHEAQAASSLDHPNICTIHEIDETKPAPGEPGDGQTFIVMACYEGQTLKEKICSGQLPVDTVIDISIQIAKGLAKAHEDGIVHRDIKPANIMITNDGVVKIVDFGLAKLAGQVGLTKTRMTVGTPAYMSPEQTQGKEVDARTDIWSLGVMMYEMLTGQLPLKGEHEQAIIYSILNEKPQSVLSLRTDAPLQLERIISRALEKDRTKRCQRANDIISDLRAVQQKTAPTVRVQNKKTRLPLFIGGSIAVCALILLTYFYWFSKPAHGSEKSIAVLPFVDMSPQKDQEYFCDGITEELINRLSNIRELKVPARTSVFTFKGKSQDIREIGDKLKVETVLEGSVRKSGEQLRITAQLINIVDGYHLWSETYNRELKDIFAIQDEIASAIVDALKLKLKPEENQKISARPVENVSAYESYLKANAAIWRFTESSLDSALLYLQNALDIEGDNAFLYAGMARVYCQYVNIGVRQEEYLEKAETYAKKALALDPDCPQAYVALGDIYAIENVQESILYFKKALVLNPNETHSLRRLVALHVLSFGKSAAAIPFLQRFKQVDPLDPWNQVLQGFLHFQNGDYEHALEQFRKFYQSDPESPHAQFTYAWFLTYNKQLDEAFSIIDRSAKATPDNVFTKFGLLLKYGLLKDKAKTFKEMTPEFQKTCRRDNQWSYFVAMWLALADAREESLDWLENAVDRGFINYPELERDPYLDNIRGEERFKKLMERLKYEWEHFEE